MLYTRFSYQKRTFSMKSIFKRDSCSPERIIVTAWFKGGLSGRMTWQFLNALELCSPWKRKLSTFRFPSNFIFNKIEPRSFQFEAYWRKALISFWRHKQAKWLLYFSNVSSGSYLSLCSMLSLSCQNLWITLKILLNH